MTTMTASTEQSGFDKVKAQRGLMWFGIISIVMLFAGPDRHIVESQASFAFCFNIDHVAIFQTIFSSCCRA